MPKLLVIESSPRGDASVSRNMTRRFVDAWRAAHPDGDVVVRDLMKTDLTFVTAPWLQAYFTPPDLHTTEMKGALALSDELVAELLDADEIAIGTPVYNYNVPAVLKAWIDHIVRKGLTLGHDGKGLVTGTSASILLASGGVYTEGSPIAARDIATQYLRLLLNVIGIEDITFVAGGGAKAVDLGELTMDAFVSSIEGKIKAAAA
ncbi:FMN-dependent NADH-azoreductase [Pseudooceanicola spongiae]|uniref:FMN dependent NADH:quinone oxidoreductase n=1 Tax=Pseudooceanicola spongiae TaxID=2613965 RepID=A0A7L9WM98_9RHOB|nr:NAD(P)H-dependent oxidoreductase [Pseudooceanicola spongiae]QOL80847.1 FMN-dependent NADH-azoreductase [Pseudooceanicola spongiae]